MTMKERQKYTQQMVSRVCEFGTRHADVFSKGTAAGELLKALHQDLIDLTAHATGQISGDGSVRTSRASRAAARDELQFTLERMHQTARALKLERFYMPRTQSDETLMDCGEAFAKDAKLVAEEFVRQGFPPTFIDDLKTAVNNLRTARLEL